MATTTTLSDINEILKESDQKLDTISNRIGKWLQGESDRAGDRLEAERRAQRAASRAQRAAAVISSRSSQSATAPDATTFRAGFMQGMLGAAGVTAVAGFASGLVTSIFGDRRLKTNLAASAGRMLGRGTMYGSMALAVSTFGEDVIGNFLDSLDPNDVTFTEEQKQDIASRTTDGITSTLVASMFTRNPWVRLAAFVGGAFGDEIYTGIENAFGEENLRVNNPFGIGPDELDFTQGPLKDALVMAVPLLAAGLLRVAGRALVTRLAVPLTAGAAVGILEAIGWKGLADLIDAPPAVPPGRPTTPGLAPSVVDDVLPNGSPGTAAGTADKATDAVRRVAALSDDAIAAIRDAGYGVNTAGRLYDLSNGLMLSLDDTIALIDRIQPPSRPSMFKRGLGWLGQRTSSAFSRLANSWVGKAGRFLGKYVALPVSAAVEGFFGYTDPQMKEAGMSGFNRAATGLGSGMIGGTLDVGAWLAEKGLGLFGADVDIPDFSEAIRDAAILEARGEGWRLINLGRILGQRAAGVDPMATSVLDTVDPSTYTPLTPGTPAYDMMMGSTIRRNGAENFYKDPISGEWIYSPLNSTGRIFDQNYVPPPNITGSIMDQYFNGTLGGGQGGVYAPTVNEGSTINNNFNSGYVVEGTPTDNANGGSNFGFIGGSGMYIQGH